MHSGTGSTTRLAWWLSGLALVAGLVYLMATAQTGPADPTEATAPQSHATVVFNSGDDRLPRGPRGGADLRGRLRQPARRQPGEAPADGSRSGNRLRGDGRHLVRRPGRARRRLAARAEARGDHRLLAIVVLLVVLNWFVHKVYWSDWIGAPPPSAAQGAHAGRPRRHHRPDRARLHQRLPRGLRGRPLPPEPGAQERHGRRARGRRDRPGRHRRRRAADLLAPPQAALPQDADPDRRAGRASCWS